MLSARNRASEKTTGFAVPEPALAVEKRLEDVERVTGLSAVENFVIIERSLGSREKFQLLEGELPAELQVAPGITDLAWNLESTELCAITLTDIHWLHVSPFEVFFTATGKNPVGVAWQTSGMFWALPTEDQFSEFVPIQKEGVWNLKQGSTFALKGAAEGQGTRASIAMAEDGRVAIYRGRRVQFFANHQAAPLESSIIADGGGGVFRELIWDKSGDLLGVTFNLTNGFLRLESWQMSKDFPPKASALQPVDLECQWIVSANYGRSYMARSRQRGIFRFDPVAKAETPIDKSTFARQTAPLACTADGTLLAMVGDQNIIRLLAMPVGTWFADLSSPRPSGISRLAWDVSGRRLASVTDDDYVQVWNLAPWQQWISQNRLEK